MGTAPPVCRNELCWTPSTSRSIGTGWVLPLLAAAPDVAVELSGEPVA